MPVSDVELVDGNSGGTLARMLHYGVGGGEGGGGGMLSGTTSVRERKRTSLTRTLTPSALLSGSSDTSPINGGVSAQGHQGHRGARAVNGGGAAEDLAQDMNNLMHDFDVISRISSLIGTLKGQYEVSSESIQARQADSYCTTTILQGLNTEMTGGHLNDIQKSIRQKDEEMSWADASKLQFSIRGSSKNEKPESFTFQCRDPNVKKEWIVGKGY